MFKMILLRELSFFAVIIHGVLLGNSLFNDDYFAATLWLLAGLCWSFNYVMLCKIVRRY